MQYANRSIGNALTILSFFTSQFVVFYPFEADIYSGITRTRNFGKFCTTLPVPGTSVNSVRHSIPVPELSICVLSVGYTQNHTRGIYPRYYPTNNFCKFYRTLIPVPRPSESSVRTPVRGTGTAFLYRPELLWVLYARATIPGTSGSSVRLKFRRSHIPVPGTSESSVRQCHKDPVYGYGVFIPARNFCKFCTPVPQ